MKTIAENLASAMASTDPEKKIGVVVTVKGPLSGNFNVTSFEGLDGLYHGRLSQDEIRRLAKTPNVQSVELDQENTIQ